MFDRLIVSILRNESKQPLFSVEERTEMLHEVVHVYPNVEVDSFDGLLVDYAAAHTAFQHAWTILAAVAVLAALTAPPMTPTQRVEAEPMTPAELLAT